MSAPVKLITPAERGNQETIRELREALAAAESGEVIGCIGILEGRDGYRPFGTSTLSRLQTAGALLELAVMRVQEEE